MASPEAVELKIIQAQAARGLRLASILHHHGVTAARADRYDPGQRHRVALAAGLTKDPSDDTWWMAVLMLKINEMEAEDGPTQG